MHKKLLFLFIACFQLFCMLSNVFSFKNNLTTIVGTGISGYNGDGNLAIYASLSFKGFDAVGIVCSHLVEGEIIFSDVYNYRIRKISTNGVITTFAGTGEMGFSGDGGLAILAKIAAFKGMAVNANGEVFFSDDSNRIRKVNTKGIISTFAGTGSLTYVEGALANSTGCSPVGLTFNSKGELFFTDMIHYSIRKISTNGTITTIAGSGNSAYTGDGGLAKDSQLVDPKDLKFTSKGELIFIDGISIRKIGTNGIITTIVSSNLRYPTSLGISSIMDEIFLVDSGNNQIRKISKTDSSNAYISSTLEMVKNEIINPSGLGLTSTEIYFTEPVNNIIRKLTPECGYGWTGLNCSTPVCSQSCVNGNCSAPNTCSCDSGWQGAQCEQAICLQSCVNGQCTAPNVCTCNSGWKGSQCDQATCSQSCVNGNCSNPNTCSCNIGWQGSQCQTAICSQWCAYGICSSPNTCSCNSGWKGSQCEIPICSQTCINGVCTAPNTCTCINGWEGSNCGTNTIRVNSVARVFHSWNIGIAILIKILLM